MKSVTHRGPAVLAAVAALAAAACGSSGSKTLSHEQLVAQANAACTRANTQLKQVQQPTSLQTLPNYLDRIGPIANQLQRELAALKPSQSDKAAYQRYLSSLASGIGTISQLRTAAQQRNALQIQQLLGQLRSNPAASDAKALGLTSCSRTSA